MAVALSMHDLPLWLVTVLTVLLVLGSLELGMLLAARRSRRSPGETSAPIGSVVGASLGLLAFMLAFTFGMAATRFDRRKELLLEETNAIGTAELRARYLSEPRRSEVRRLLREYVDVRVDGALHTERLAAALERSEAIHEELWSHVVALAGASAGGSASTALFISSLNDVIDLHTLRAVVGLEYRIPLLVWLVLYLLSVLAMVSVGFHFGSSRAGRSLVNVVMALAFSTVIFLIADLDRSSEGSIQVDQQPLIELQQRIHASGS